MVKELIQAVRGVDAKGAGHSFKSGLFCKFDSGHFAYHIRLFTMGDTLLLRIKGCRRNDLTHCLSFVLPHSIFEMLA